MKSMGYTAVIQDRAKTKFTICNATFFRSSKLCHTWTESRSRALITGFKLIPDMVSADHAQLDNPSVGSTAATKEGVRDSPSVGGTDVGTNGAAEVFIANCHLEGHPWKAQERFNQMKGVLGRIERRQNEADAPMDDTRILLVGVLTGIRYAAAKKFCDRCAQSL